jgi:hypothetical protein
MASSYDKIEAELAKWIEGKVVARKTGDYGATIVVTALEDGYTVLRAFSIGDGAGVSMDLQHATADEVFNYLLMAYN